MKLRVFNMEELGEAIRRARRERHLTQIELAERANVARGALQKLEEGRGTVTMTTVFKILRALSLDLNVASRESANATLFEERGRDV